LAGIRATIKAGLGMSAADLIVTHQRFVGGFNYHRTWSPNVLSHTLIILSSTVCGVGTEKASEEVSTWLRKKYYERNRRHNVFLRERYDDEDSLASLAVRAKSTPIKRHIKCKASEPYDPRTKPYFEDREGFICWTRSGVQDLRFLWMEQHGSALFAISNHSNHGLAPSPLRPSCEGGSKSADNAFYFIQSATTGSRQHSPYRSRVSLKEAFAGLEP